MSNLGKTRGSHRQFTLSFYILGNLLQLEMTATQMLRVKVVHFLALVKFVSGIGQSYLSEFE